MQQTLSQLKKAAQEEESNFLGIKWKATHGEPQRPHNSFEKNKINQPTNQKPPRLPHCRLQERPMPFVIVLEKQGS